MNPLFKLLVTFLVLLSQACRTAEPVSTKTASGSAHLMKAREQFRLAAATRERIEQELTLLLASTNPDPALVKDYQTYLDRVTRMEAAFGTIVHDMESLSGSLSIAQETENPGAGLDAGAAPKTTLPDRESIDAITALDRQLNQALSDFDKILLKENADIGAKMEEVAQANAGKLQELAQEAAEAAAKIKDRQAGNGTKGESGEKEGSEGESTAAAGKGGGKAGQPGEPGSEETGEKGEDTTGRPTKGKPEDKPAGSQTAGGESVGTPSTGSSGKQGGDKKVTHPGAEDDDIVARQLREAAEAESDPVLKGKLWKEYDDYKKSTRR